jgi:hypothetical protein
MKRRTIPEKKIKIHFKIKRHSVYKYLNCISNKLVSKTISIMRLVFFTFLVKNNNDDDKSSFNITTELILN